MTAAVARAVMALAARCLGPGRQQWALAMQAEFDAAVEDGKPLAFALGCLVAACREGLQQDEGQFVLAQYLLALALLLPMAALQVDQAVGFLLTPGAGLPYGMVANHAAQNPYLIWSQNSALPVLQLLWLSLGVAHLGLAWVLVEGDWTRVVKLGALIGAATITLSVFTGVLLLDMSLLIAHGPKRAIALAAILATARWHARLSHPTERLAR
ncbi:hypothetical protein [Sphingomonas hengshuiensis]|uniref:Uncharacterized protein n=1 Tax=Sphingomonas hengshuiensis TaxID=1609977 RepID=A0A7U4J8B9_9SPHN|nr:hypothetical protein [Sphingomonas hengshuiensis]AJP72122.1 hypothetical protein TS85_10495 [Sphingomonas hengshuiensis]